MWYSTVTGTAPGFYGNSAPNPSTNVHLQNFAIFGNVQERDDSAQVNGIGGAMSNSTVSNIWIEHMKVGAWMDGPMDKPDLQRHADPRHHRRRHQLPRRRDQLDRHQQRHPQHR